MLLATTDDTDLAAAALTVASGADGGAMGCIVRRSERRDDAPRGSVMRRVWFLCTRLCRFPDGGSQIIVRHEIAGTATAVVGLPDPFTVIGTFAARAAMERLAARVPAAQTITWTSPNRRFRDSRPKQGILPRGSDPGAPR